jgi:hypothetical protein
MGDRNCAWRGASSASHRKAKCRNNVRVEAILKRKLQKTLAKVKFLTAPGPITEPFLKKKRCCGSSRGPARTKRKTKQ